MIRAAAREKLLLFDFGRLDGCRGRDLWSRFRRWRRNCVARRRAGLNHRWLVPSPTPAHRRRPALAAPVVLAAVPVRTLRATWPGTWGPRRLTAWTRRARTLTASRAARVVGAICARRAIPTRRAELRTIPTRRAELRTIPARRTATRGPIASRPITRAWTPAIETRTTRWPAWLLPSRRVHWPAIATASLLRSAGQHPALASFGHLAPGQVGVAAEGIEAARSPAPAASPAWTTATAPARTTAWAATTAPAARPTAWAAATTATIPIAATATTTTIIAA